MVVAIPGGTTSSCSPSSNSRRSELDDALDAPRIHVGRAESDPSRDLRGALTPWKPAHYPTLSDARDVGRLLREIEAYEGGFITKCAMKLSPMLFVQPGELRRVEWCEINLESAEWRIAAAKMKGRVLHIVPLATQAVGVLRERQALTGKSRWVFPGVRTHGERMSEHPAHAALRRLGYDRTMITAQCFRGMASTLLHEYGWPSDVIQRQVSHAERNAVEAAHNRAEHLPARRKMMQAWADHLDALRAAGALIAFRAYAMSVICSAEP